MMRDGIVDADNDDDDAYHLPLLMLSLGLLLQAQKWMRELLSVDGAHGGGIKRCT